MIERVAADGDYGQPAEAGWRGEDWACRERDALVAGRRLHYLDHGSGERCVVLIHGLGGRWQHWLEVIPALAEVGRVVAVDLPGFGASELPLGRTTLEGYADAVAELVGQLGVGPVLVAGHSMGGPVAIRFAARHPELTAGLALVAGAIVRFSALLGLRDVARTLVERPRTGAAIVMELLTAGLPVPAPVQRLVVGSPRLRGLFLSPYVADTAALALDTAELIVAGAGARGVVPAVRAIAGGDIYAGIDRVACPILSLAASEDRVAPLADAEAFQRAVPRARTVVLEESGHMPMLERPRALNRQLMRFAGSLPAY